MREEFNAFEDEDEKQPSKKMVPEDKYEELKVGSILSYVSYMSTLKLRVICNACRTQ